MYDDEYHADYAERRAHREWICATLISIKG